MNRRLNAKTAKKLRAAARELAQMEETNYVENTNKRSQRFLGTFDKAGNPMVYDVNGPFYVDPMCYKGAYKNLKKEYKRGKPTV